MPFRYTLLAAYVAAAVWHTLDLSPHVVGLLHGFAAVTGFIALTQALSYATWIGHAQRHLDAGGDHDE